MDAIVSEIGMELQLGENVHLGAEEYLQANCPPESGGQHDRDSSRDRAGGGSRASSI
jgi:hypothetical protein